MWIQATSKDQLVKGTKFRFYWYVGDQLSDNFAYEATFVDNYGTSRIDALGEYVYVSVGDMDSHDLNDMPEQYKIWVEEETPAQYIKNVFGVLLREWEDEQLCARGVVHFIENVLNEAITNNDSVEDIKRHIVEYVDDRYSGQFADLLDGIGIESNPVKLTITIENGKHIDFVRDEFLDWLSDQPGGRHKSINVEVKYV